MDIKQYLDNPMGKGAIIQGKQLILDDLNKRYEKLKSNNEFKCEIYKDGNTFIFHVKVPSESERDNDYDVVIELSPESKSILDKTLLSDESLLRYNMRVFSNCPSFIFTYAYAYNEHELFIDYLQKRLDDLVFKSAPTTKNPMNMVNFEKSIYFACKYLVEEKDMKKNSIKSFAQRFKKKDFIASIRTQAEIMQEIKRAKLALKDEKDKELTKNKKPERTKNIMNKENTPNDVKMIKSTKSNTTQKNVKNINVIKAKKSSGNSGVKKIKKIKGKR